MSAMYTSGTSTAFQMQTQTSPATPLNTYCRAQPSILWVLVMAKSAIWALHVPLIYFSRKLPWVKGQFLV